MVVWERGAGPTLACGTGAHPRAAPGCLRAAPDASREDLQQTAPASSGTDGQMHGPLLQGGSLLAIRHVAEMPKSGPT